VKYYREEYLKGLAMEKCKGVFCFTPVLGMTLVTTVLKTKKGVHDRKNAMSQVFYVKKPDNAACYCT